MNAVLLALVIVVGLAAAANLTVTFALVRRVATLESAPHGGGGGGNRPLPQSGDRVGAFTVQTTTGDRITERDLTGTTMVAFLMPGCAPCKALVAVIKEGLRPPGVPLIVMIAGKADDPAVQEYVADIPASARIAMVPLSGGPAAAFKVSAYPAIIKVEDGVVRMAASRLESVDAGH